MIRYLPDKTVDRSQWPVTHKRADYPEWPDADELANALDKSNAERDRLRAALREVQIGEHLECAKPKGYCVQCGGQWAYGQPERHLPVVGQACLCEEP